MAWRSPDVARWCANSRWSQASTSSVRSSPAHTRRRGGRQGHPQRLGHQRAAIRAGCAARACAASGWCRCPRPSPRQAMAIGTAGCTRDAVRDGARAPRVVRSAARCWSPAPAGRGGDRAAVAGWATVVASTGRPQEADYLRELGAGHHRPQRARPARPCARQGAGRAWSTRWAATPWPTPAPPRCTAARSRPAVWRRV